MDVLLHIGMQKSGSTAIQHRFTDLAPWLDAHGLHYPEGLGTPHNQSLLVAAGLGGQTLPRHFEKMYRGRTARAVSDLSDWYDRVLETAARAGARTLVLSAETLFRVESMDDPAAVARLLRRAGGRLTALAYLRRPSHYYLAQVQQRLKASHVLLRPGPVRYRPALETWGGLADELRVRAYDRDAFPGRDIARAVFAEAGGDPADMPPPGADRAAGSNVSLGAEGMALLQDYRAAFHPKASRRHRKDSNALLVALAEAEAASWPPGPPGPPARARLHPDLADRIDHASIDLAWVREKFGIAFEGVDYARLGTVTSFPKVRQVADICPVESATRDRLALETTAALARWVVRLRSSEAKEQEDT